MSRKNHLDAARLHRNRALTELRRLAADSALYWILSHRERVSKFRRAIRNTRAAAPFQRVLAEIRKEATALPKPARKVRKAHKRRSARRSTRGPGRPAYGTYF